MILTLKDLIWSGCYSASITEAHNVAYIRRILTELLAEEVGARDGKLFDTTASAGHTTARGAPCN